MFLKKVCSVVTSIALLFSQVANAAGIEVDTSASSNNRPSLENAQNGVPIVNIVAPNSGGLSHNKFNTYNVEKQGLILNNAQAVANTQLAGYISRNTNLDGGSAKLILNEVTGTSRSLLQGYTEVAGAAADVIVANPNGISVNGGGFINTPKVTLTTGNPFFNGNNLGGFNVTSGDILIEGDGFNVGNIDKVNLYTKALQLNSKIYAQELNVVTGDNSIALDGTVSSLGGSGSGVSIDSSLLGGIYANIITLQSNDTGVGVNLPPEVLAQKDLTIDVNGNIVFTKAIANETLKVTAKDIENPGIIAAQNLEIDAENITNKGALYSTNDMTIKAKNLTNEEMIRSNDEINLFIEDTLTNTKDGMIYADGDITLAANEVKEKINTITNKGVIQSHKNINITAKTLNNTATAPVYTPKSSSSTKTVPLGGSNNFNIVTTTVSTEVLTVPTDPALILAEGDINIDVETLNNYYSLISSDNDIVLNATTANNVGKVAVTTTRTVTQQYRNERYCASRVCGSCVNHKERAGYRGSFTSVSTSKVPAVNYGIQAKRTITGNVVTLNNVNNPDNIVNEQKIIQTQDAMQQVESNTISLQNGVNGLGDNNEQINLTLNQVDDMETLISGVQTEDDFITFKEDITSIQNALEESITKDQENITTLESMITYSKSLDATPTMNEKITELESSLVSLNDNLTQSQTNLSTLQDIDTALNALEDIELQKQALLDIDSTIKETINSNGTLIETLQNDILDTMTGEFQTLYNTLNSELQVALDKQESVKETVISNQEGVYQTTNSPTLQTAKELEATVTDSNGVVSNLTLPKSEFGLFVLNTDEEHNYLIESNPLYTNYQTFISSDYMMGKLGYDSSKAIQRLGDAMYETTLIRNSIIKLSGQRYLQGYDTDLAQYKGLMDNAVEVKDDLNLAFGVTLTKEQINRLNKDIVWMEERIVEGQKVLVPIVYLASLDTDNLKDGTQIIAGEDIALFTSGTLQNQGKIEARNNLVLLSNDIQNHGGTIEAKNDATLNSNTDIQNISGDIKAGNDLELNANNNINIKSSTNQKTFNYAQGYQTTTFKGKDATLKAGGNLKVNAGDAVTVQGSQLQVQEDATIIAKNGDVNIDATQQKEKFDFDVYGGYYKGDSLKNNGSTVEAKNLTVLTNGNLNINGSTVKAQEDANIYANNVNITSTTDTSSSEYKSESKGFFSSSTTKQEKQTSQNIASLLQSNNVNIETGNLTLIASKIKANEAQITAEIINLISSKDSEYESNFSDSSGILTRTIETKGYIKEILKEAKIEVSDKLIVNNKDITNQLTTDNIIKTLSSQSNLSLEQINLVKATLNNKEWNDKTTTLSGVGALIVAIVVAVCTAGAGLAVVGAAGTAAAGTTAAAVQAAVVQSVVTSVTTQLATSVITGNSFKLDEKSLVKGAVSAGVMSYASSVIDSSLNLENVKVADMDYSQQFQQGVSNTVVKSAVDSAVYGTDFKDSLKTGLVTNVSNLGFRAVGDTSMQQYLGKDNTLFKDGALGKVALHSIVGAGTAELLGEDAKAGAVSAGVNELASPLLDGLDNENQIAFSGLIGGLSAGAVGGESQISTGQTIAQSGTKYNRQLHQDEIKFIEENAQKFADEKGISLQDAKSRLAQQGLRGTDKAWSLILGEDTDTQAQDFITKNSNGLFSVKNEYEFKDGTTNGQSEISNLNQNDYNQLKTFYQNNVYVSTSTNQEGARFLGEAYKQDIGKELDSVNLDTVNQAIRDIVPNTIEGIQNTPETINSAGNYLENVFPTTTQNRMDELYNQGSVGSQTQANLATMDAIGTASMVTGVGAVGKSVVGGVTEGVVKSVDNSLNIDMKSISINGNQVELTNVGSKGNWDKLVNKDLKPDTAYQLDNGHTYITNAQGKVNYVEADLNKIAMDRNNYQQNVVGKSGEANDQGGHLIASSLGGAGDRINLLPMDKVLNNGTYKKMESDLAKALDQGKDVSVKIDVGYPDGGVRPNSFIVTTTINGIEETIPFRQ